MNSLPLRASTIIVIKESIVRFFLVLLVIMNLTACASGYTMGGKHFSSKSEALTYQNSLSDDQISKVQPATYYGGSMLVHMPTDDNLSQHPFVSGTPSPDLLDYFLKFYKNDFSAIQRAIDKSKMFDSTDLVQTSSYLRYAKDHGYRYLAVNNGDGSWGIFDLLLGEDKLVRFPKGLDNMVYVVEDAISKFESKQGSRTIADNFKPVSESFEYDDNTRRGVLSVAGKGIEARYWMLKKIGDVASTKNVAIKAGEKASQGAFIVTDEKIENGVFTIAFETLY